MRSAPTLNSWMIPCSSVAMIENLGLVSTACCNASALSRTLCGEALAGRGPGEPGTRDLVAAAGIHNRKACAPGGLCATARTAMDFSPDSAGTRKVQPATVVVTAGSGG